MNYLKQRTLAHWVAMDMVRSVQVGIIPPPKAESPITGTTDMLNEIFYWRIAFVKNYTYAEEIVVTVSRALKAEPLSTLTGFVPPSMEAPG